MSFSGLSSLSFTLPKRIYTCTYASQWHDLVSVSIYLISAGLWLKQAADLFQRHF